MTVYGDFYQAELHKKGEMFAAAALNGMLAHPRRYRPRPDCPEDWHIAIAEEAFEIAEAMISQIEISQIDF